MAQVNEQMCRDILKMFEEGRRYPLTIWEQSQLAWTWLKHNGHEVPVIIGTPGSQRLPSSA